MTYRLLLVDDEEDILSTLRRSLRRADREIFIEPNGRAALDFLRENSVDCVVCDINMPQMDGISFIRELRQREADLPVIFFTGHGNEQLMLEAAKLGAFDFIDKPFFTDLLEVVNRGLEHGKARAGDLPKESKLQLYRDLLKEIG